MATTYNRAIQNSVQAAIEQSKHMAEYYNNKVNSLTEEKHPLQEQHKQLEVEVDESSPAMCLHCRNKSICVFTVETSQLECTLATDY